MSPRFSVVIPTRERCATLQHTIKTVLNQTFKDFELIIMDNFSQDETSEVVSSFADARIKYYRSDKRLSMMDNWELSLSHVNGEYLIYIGDDDALIPDSLLLANRLFLAYSDVNIIKWIASSYC